MSGSTDRNLTRIGFNIGTWFVNNMELEHMYQYIEKENPTTTLFMEGFYEAMVCYERQKKANPNSNPIVIYRDFNTLGKDDWKSLTVDQVVDTVNHIWGMQNQHIWVYLLNEPHANGESEVKRLSDFLSACIERLCSQGYNLVVGNFSAGTIDHPEWMKSFLESASRWNDKVLLSEHMYSAVMPCNAGWVHARFPFDNSLMDLPIEVSLDYLHPRYWLTPDQVQYLFDAPFHKEELWHYGRIKQFYEYAKINHLQLPKFVATEGLLDSMGDLKKTPDGNDRKFNYKGQYGNVYEHMTQIYGTNYREFKGDISYSKMYSIVYDDYFEDVMAMILRHMDRILPEQCLGVTLFTYSNSKDWTDFGHNYMDYPILDALMENDDSLYYSFDNVYDFRKEDDMLLPELDLSLFNPHVVVSAGVVNLRKEPTTTSQVIGTLGYKDLVDFADGENYEYNDNQWTWKPLIKNGTVGWFASELVKLEKIVVDEPDDAPTDEYLTKVEIEKLIEEKGYVLPEGSINVLAEALKGMTEHLGNILAILQEYD